MLKREKIKTRYDHSVHEDATLSCVIGKCLEPSPWKNKLREFCDVQLNNLKLFILKFPKGPRSLFQELDINASVSQQLTNLAKLEYPVIHVFLPSHTYDFEVVKDLKHLPYKPKNLKLPAKDNLPSQEGVLFKEEEIEDDGNGPDSRVLDLLMRSEPDAGSSSCHRFQKAEDELNNKPSNKLETSRPAGC